MINMLWIQITVEAVLYLSTWLKVQIFLHPAKSFKYVNNRYAKIEYKGMKTFGVTDYTN